MSENADPNKMIHVLVVDDIPETRENLKKLLYFEKDIQVVGSASDGAEGVEMVMELQPDVVLMDINMPGMDGVTAGEKISESAPNTQVIMMSVQGEADYLRRSMLAGAREFLIKPFTAEELVTSIRRVYDLGQRRRPATPPPPQGEALAPVPVAQPVPPSPKGRVITVYGAKGGVGTSTVVTNLAIAIREVTKTKVAIVDGSLQFGDVGVLLNLSSQRSIVDAVEQIDDLDEEFLAGLLITHSSGVKALLSPPKPEMAELVTTEHLTIILEKLRLIFDYIVIDTWTSFQEPTLTLFDLSDRIILLTTTEITAIKNTKTFFEVTEALTYEPEKILLVLNKHDPRGGIRVRDIEASVKHPVLTDVIRDDAATTKAVNQGLPVVQGQPNSAVGQNLLHLAQQIVEQLPPPGPTETMHKKQAATPGGLFRRWRKR
ncbi:MAG: response regulator/pilus assembly protein [Chloroflexi bacterium]|nr:response regulator/pilus assembly protein [Chloroflexota bacterium]